MTVVSHKYKFIFLKTAKTAGTSVELLLNKICGEEDICSPITKWTKWDKGVIRPDENSHQPKNATGLFIPRPFLDRPWKKRNEYRFKNEFRDFFRGWKFRAHMGATETRARTGTKIWDSYHKFTIERNPWDKAVSAYYFAQRYKKTKCHLNNGYFSISQVLQWITTVSMVKLQSTTSFNMRT